MPIHHDLSTAAVLCYAELLLRLRTYSDYSLGTHGSCVFCMSSVHDFIDFYLPILIEFFVRSTVCHFNARRREIAIILIEDFRLE